MNPVLRAIIIYTFLLIVFRFAGKRTLKDMSVFDFVLMLFISEAVNQGLVGEDFSITNALLLVLTLMTLDVVMSLLKQSSKVMERLIDGYALIIVEEGKPLKDRMHKARVDEEDIMHAARAHHGLERMDQIKFAVLEKDGSISIIPKKE
jgi:uncharacterized membrane protein YcaP (DUF421 family)